MNQIEMNRFRARMINRSTESMKRLERGGSLWMAIAQAERGMMSRSRLAMAR